MQKRSVLLLIAAILGAAYLVYSIVYWGGVNSAEASTAEAIGAGIATALVLPHLICTGIALLFNILGWAMRHRGFALTAGILYSVAILLFAVYFMFVVIEAALCYIAFARMKKQAAAQQSVE